jgi:hypothetical protein
MKQQKISLERYLALKCTTKCQVQAVLESQRKTRYFGTHAGSILNTFRNILQLTLETIAKKGIKTICIIPRTTEYNQNHLRRKKHTVKKTMNIIKHTPQYSKTIGFSSDVSSQIYCSLYGLNQRRILPDYHSRQKSSEHFDQ